MRKKDSKPKKELSPKEKNIVDKAIVNSQAKKVYHRKILIRSTTLILSVIFLLLLTSFGVSSLLNSKGGLSVLVNQRDSRISLSETRDLEKKKVYLNAKGIDYCDNITYDWLPDDLDQTDGSHNGDNYFAYTFYLINTGTETVNVYSELKVTANTMNAVEATRIMVIKDDVTNIYAKPRTSDGKTEEVPKQVVNFNSDTQVYEETIAEFVPESLIKYTIVIWLEGFDPECDDNILGGGVKFVLEFSIIDDQEEPSTPQS